MPSDGGFPRFQAMIAVGLQMTEKAFPKRRKRARVALRWAVYLKRPSAEGLVCAETQNLSSQGFYCFSPEPFTPGETINCILNLPALEGSSARRTLHARATVLRADRIGSNLYGIACHIEDYSFSSGAA